MLSKLRAWPHHANVATIITVLMVVILLQVAAIAYLVDMRILAGAAIFYAFVVAFVNYREAVRK